MSSAVLREFECLGVLGLLAKLSGQIGREGDQRLGAIERMIRESETADQITGATAREAAKPAARRRLRALVADLAVIMQRFERFSLLPTAFA